MSFFQGSRNTIVLGGTQVAVAAGGTLNNVSITQEGQPAKTLALRALSEAAAHTALHNSSARYDAPRCHRNTRAKQLDKLELWILGKSEEFAKACLIWLSGGAGAGKSAIMQSIIERCLPRGVVLGSFFFFRADPSRNKAEVLIPTLSYQLIRAYPAAMTVLEPIITRDPLIFRASLKTQAYELLVRPLLYLKETGVILQSKMAQGAFFIDGLDECDTPRKQALVIETVATILRDHSLPIVFLIASRPEIAIQDQFHRQYGDDPTFSTMALDDDDEARADIQQYIEDRFFDIVELHPMRHHVTLPWPPRDSIKNLVSKSSGHFIYAAIAMNYIASHDEHPVRALKVIEDLRNTHTGTPFAELDALYHHILTSAKYSAELLNILRHRVFTGFGPELDTLCRVHDITPADVQLYLSDVQALVSVSYAYGKLSIQIKHASLIDFLYTPLRAQHLYISDEDYTASLVPRLFYMLDHTLRLQQGPMIFFEQYSGEKHTIPIDARDILINGLFLGLSQFSDPQGSQILMRHSPRLLWGWIKNRREPLMLLSYTVAIYMGAIRDSEIGRKDVELYPCHFQTYLQILLDSLDPLKNDALYLDYPPTDMSFWKEHFVDCWQRNENNFAEHDIPLPRPTKNYGIIPALIFSSTQSTLRLAHHALFRFWLDFDVNPCYACYLSHLVSPSWSPINPRTMRALRSFPESRRSWGPELALLMRLALRKLLHEAWTPPFYVSSRHEQWLKRRKPGKHVSLGSPIISSRFYDYRRGRPVTKYDYDNPYDFCSSAFKSVEKISLKKSRIMFPKGNECVLLLRLVISFLRKADCTPEVVKLARRSLPLVAGWFPKLMRRARREMEAYVLRWEESTEGLLERAQLLEINDMD